MKFNYENIPAEMKREKRWVLFKLIKKDDKITKMPINAINGMFGKSNDATTWTTFEQAEQNLTRFRCDGLGFMLGDGWVGIDIDHAIPDQKELVNEFVSTLNSYSEYSQSKTGIHIIVKGTLPSGANRNKNIEMYCFGRFFALTGDVYQNHKDLHKTNIDESLKELWLKYIYQNNKSSETKKKSQEIVKDISINEFIPQKLNNNEIELIEFIKMNDIDKDVFSDLYDGNWQKHFGDHSSADFKFCFILAYWLKKKWSLTNNYEIANIIDKIVKKSGLMRDKWNEYRGSKKYSEITIGNAIGSANENLSTSRQTIKILNMQNKEQYDFDDTGNAKRFADFYCENLKYNHDNKCWMYYTNGTWKRDLLQIVKLRADQMIQDLKEEIGKKISKEQHNELLNDYIRNAMKNIKRLSSSAGKESMIKETQHLNNIPVLNENLDTNNFLLNCKNGVVDLTTGAIMPHSPDLLMSKNTNVDVLNEIKEPTRWIKFLNEVFDGDQKLIDFVQKAVGYSLTGSTKEQVLFQCYGKSGCNGKSVFFEILSEILGTYAITFDIESLLTAKKNTGANSDIARMQGARCGIANEPDESSKFKSNLVKRIVAGDKTVARFLYGMEFEFRPVIKFWIATNFKIKINGRDNAMVRRMVLIPFNQTFEGERKNKNLVEELKQELPEILMWAIQGCRKWQEEGLDIENTLQEEIKQYREENDMLLTYINDNIVKYPLDPSFREKASDVYNDFKIWAKNSNEYEISQRAFGQEIKKIFDSSTINGNVYYLGMKLKKHTQIKIKG